MKLSALAVLLLCSLLVQRASTQDAITTIINQIASANPTALYNMGAQPFSEINFQTLARAVGGIFTTLQILTLPYIRNQLSSLQGSVQGFPTLINTLNSTLIRVNQTLTSEMKNTQAQDLQQFQSLNRSLTQINTTVNAINGSNCCANLTLLTSRFNAFLTQDAADKLTLRTGISTLNTTIRANNSATVAALAALRANITMLDAEITALAAQASRNNTLTNARIDGLDTTFTQNSSMGQVPEDQLFAYYNQTLANLTNAVKGMNSTPVDLSAIQAAIDNISQYLIDEQAKKDATFAALNQSVGNLASNLSNLALNVSSLNGSLANLTSDLSNLSAELTHLSSNFLAEKALEEAQWAALNSTLNNITANLSNLSNAFDQDEAADAIFFASYHDTLGNLTAHISDLAANVSNLSVAVDNLTAHISELAANVSNNSAVISNISQYLIDETKTELAHIYSYVDQAIYSNISAVDINASLTASNLAGNISEVQSLIAGNVTALNKLILSNVTQLNDAINTSQMNLSSRIDTINSDLSKEIRTNNETLNEKIDTNQANMQTYVDSAFSTINDDIRNLYANDTITVYRENPTNFNANVVFKTTITEDGTGIASTNRDRIDYYANYQYTVFTNSPTVTSSLEYIGSDFDNPQKVSLTLEQVSSFLFVVRFATLDGTPLVHNEWKANIIAYGN